MGSQMLLLNWNDHKNTMIAEFQQLFSHSELMDVTLACDGFSLQAHKMVLSASSKFFRNLFLMHPCKHAIVVLADVDSEELKAIVDFIYQGQVHIAEGKLTKFLATAEKLKIKGLSTIPQDENFTCLEEPVASVDSMNQPSKHIDTASEKQLGRLCLATSCERSKQQQEALSLNNRSNTSINYEIVKKESVVNEQSLHEHIDNLLEPDFSHTINEMQVDSNGISQNQPLSQPMKSVSQESAQWVSQIYQTDGVEKCSNTLREMEVPVSEAHQLLGASNMHSFQIHKLQEIVNCRTEMEHSKSFDFECSICKKIFNSRTMLLTHQATHTEELPFHCNICNKRFKSKQGMKFHMMGHSGEKPYSCNICDKKFSRQRSVEIHKRIHTGERPFGCNYCKKRFSDKTNLIVHTRVHTGEKPFSCHICKRGFSKKKSLVAHLVLHFTRNGFPSS